MYLDTFFVKFWHKVLVELKQLSNSSNVAIARVVVIVSILLNVFLFDIFTLIMAFGGLFWLLNFIDIVNDRIDGNESYILTTNEIRKTMTLRFIAMLYTVLRFASMLLAGHMSVWGATVYAMGGLLFAAPAYFILDFDSEQLRN